MFNKKVLTDIDSNLIVIYNTVTLVVLLLLVLLILLLLTVILCENINSSGIL